MPSHGSSRQLKRARTAQDLAGEPRVGDTVTGVAKSAKDPENLETQLAAAKKEISRLRRYPLSNLSTDEDFFDMRKVRELLDLTECSIVDGCSSTKLHHLDEINSQQNNLDLWARRVSGWDFNSLHSYSVSTGIFEEKLLGSLVTAGLCNLVFGAHFPAFLVEKSPLLEQYKAVILEKAGRKVLRQIDLLAHRSLIEKDSMSSFLEGKADELAHHISCTLAPVFSSVASTGGIEGLIPPREAFQQALIYALQLKACLLLSRKRYKWAFVDPGKPFDFKTMNLHNLDLRTRHVPDKWRRKHPASDSPVKLCLFPALYACTSARVSHSAVEQEPEGAETWSWDGVCVENREDCNFMEGVVEDLDELVARAVVLV